MMMRTAHLVLGLVLLAGMAGDLRADDRDPWEGFNRAMFTFNDHVDRWVLEPVAKGYDVITPDELQRCISNFFWNLKTPVSGVNNLFQAKPLGAAKELGRFTVNTTIGLAGFLDPASYFGIDRQNEDFGQTLGVWGVPQGPYLVLPLFGPSSVRDTGGLVVDSALTPTWYFVDGIVTIGARVVDTVNARSLVLRDVEDARAGAIDFYGFLRDAYLQHREAEVTDHGERSRDDGDSLYYPDAASAR
jgi:phospholipid-binding lipoprotein MlaA